MKIGIIITFTVTLIALLKPFFCLSNMRLKIIRKERNKKKPYNGKTFIHECNKEENNDNSELIQKIQNLHNVIKQLTIRNCNITKDELKSILDIHNNYEKLSFGRNNFNDDHIKLLSESIPNMNNLNTIYLDYNIITDEGVKYLVNSINESITFLDLSNNKITNKGARILEQKLGMINNFKINLSGNEINGNLLYVLIPKPFFEITIKENNKLKKEKEKGEEEDDEVKENQDKGNNNKANVKNGFGFKLLYNQISNML